MKTNSCRLSSMRLAMACLTNRNLPASTSLRRNGRLCLHAPMPLYSRCAKTPLCRREYRATNILRRKYYRKYLMPFRPISRMCYNASSALCDRWLCRRQTLQCTSTIICCLPQCIPRTVQWSLSTAGATITGNSIGHT